ncbi:MAG: hypothetical protein ACOYN0_02720 [Phycisphaerales bacterium]
MNSVLTTLSFLGNLGTWELMVIVVIGLLVGGIWLSRVARRSGK